MLALRRGENRSTWRKTSRSRVENQQIQPTYDAESGNRTRATLVEGECSDTAPTLLPLTPRTRASVKLKGGEPAASALLSHKLSTKEEAGTEADYSWVLHDLHLLKWNDFCMFPSHRKSGGHQRRAG